MAQQESPLRSEFESVVINMLDRNGEDADFQMVIGEFMNRGASRSTCYRWIRRIRDRRLKGVPFWAVTPVQPSQAVASPSLEPVPAPACALAPLPSAAAVVQPTSIPVAQAPALEILLSYCTILDDALAEDPALRRRIHARMRVICAGALAPA